MTPDLQGTNVRLCWKLETLGDTLGHQLVPNIYEEVDELLMSEPGVWSLL